METERTGSEKKAAVPVIKLFMTVVAIFVAFIIVCIFVFYRQLTPVEDVDDYAEIIAEGRTNPHRQKYLSHFPDEIPYSSEKVTFFFIPGFLQGSAIYRLRLVLPENELIAVEENLSGRPDVIPIKFEDAMAFTRPGFPVFGKSGRRAKSLFHNFENITEDFDSFLVATTPEKIREDWNHPEIAGFSISKERSEIVFWTEDG